MSKKTNQEVLDRVSYIKAKFVMGHPFIAPLCLGLGTVVDENLRAPPGMSPTAAVDGKNIYLYPDFVHSLDNEELKWLIAHETMHPLFLHMTRRGDRDPLLWNVAGDLVINYVLEEERIGKRIDGALYDKGIYERNGGVTERIYEELKQEAEKNGGKHPKYYGEPGEGGGHSSIDECLDADGNTEELEREWQTKISEAATAAKMMGKISSNFARFAKEILKPKVDWRRVLQQWVIKHKDDERSYASPNILFIPHDLILPSRSGEAVGEITVAIDCSGSIGMNELSQFASEILKIQQDLSPLKIHVIYFDSQVCHHDEFDRDTELKIEPHGGGGTAFSPVFSFMEEKDIIPTVCIVLTDLCCNDFGPPPEYPVLWVSTMRGNAPWGEVVVMED